MEAGFAVVSPQPRLGRLARGVTALQRVSLAIVIEDRAWLGKGSIILRGVVRMGRDSVVEAGSVATKDVEPRTVVPGNPAAPVLQS